MPAKPAITRERLAELLGQKTSGVGKTDPALSNLFHDFAFGPAASHGSLGERERLLAIVACLVGRGVLHPFIVYSRAALASGIAPAELKEVVIQAVPWAGMTGVADFLHEANVLLRERGVSLPLPAEELTLMERASRGNAALGALFGQKAHDLFLPQVDEEASYEARAWLVGGFSIRGVLAPCERFLVGACVLAGMGECGCDMRSCLRACLHEGLSAEDLSGIAVHLLPFIGIPRARGMLACLEQAVAEKRAEPSA